MDSGPGAVPCCLLAHPCACLSLELPANISKPGAAALADEFKKAWIK